MSKHFLRVLVILFDAYYVRLYLWEIFLDPLMKEKLGFFNRQLLKKYLEVLKALYKNHSFPMND